MQLGCVDWFWLAVDGGGRMDASLANRQGEQIGNVEACMYVLDHKAYI